MTIAIAKAIAAIAIAAATIYGLHQTKNPHCLWALLPIIFLF